MSCQLAFKCSLTWCVPKLSSLSIYSRDQVFPAQILLLFAHSSCFGLTATSARSGKQYWCWYPIGLYFTVKSVALHLHPCALPSPIFTRCRISCHRTFFWPPCAPHRFVPVPLCQLAMTRDVAPSCGHEPRFEYRFFPASLKHSIEVPAAALLQIVFFNSVSGSTDLSPSLFDSGTPFQSKLNALCTILPASSWASLLEVQYLHTA